MSRVWLVLPAVWAGAAWAAAPSYSLQSIVNGSDYAPGPVAPNSFVSIFGTDLAFDSETCTGLGTFLPTQLAGVGVYVDNRPAPLFYVGPAQINLLVPGDLIPGTYPLRVVRQGMTGPEVPITLVAAAPQLFQTPEGFAIAQHADYSVISPDAPAQPGEIIVVYAVGLGATAPNPRPGEIPTYPGLMTRLADLQVFLGTAAQSSDQILYAGLTPGWPGLYQINIRLPGILDLDPEIRAAVGDQSSPAGIKLSTQQRVPQLSTDAAGSSR